MRVPDYEVGIVTRPDEANTMILVDGPGGRGGYGLERLFFRQTERMRNSSLVDEVLGVVAFTGMVLRRQNVSTSGIKGHLHDAAVATYRLQHDAEAMVVQDLRAAQVGAVRLVFEQPILGKSCDGDVPRGRQQVLTHNASKQRRLTLPVV